MTKKIKSDVFVMFKQMNIDQKRHATHIRWFGRVFLAFFRSFALRAAISMWMIWN